MANKPDRDDEVLLEGLSRDLERLERVFDEGPSPSLEEFQLLAAHTLRRKRRRMKYELVLFMLTALLIVSIVCMAAMAAPMVLILIHGASMLAGIAILASSRKLRSAGKKGSHE